MTSELPSRVGVQAGEGKARRVDLGELRRQNVSRLERWHGDDDGWTLADWSNAMCGEAGEAANVVKKIRRTESVLWDKQKYPGDGASAHAKLADLSASDARAALIENLANELADVVCYADLLAHHAMSEPTPENLRAKQERGEEITMVDIPKSICEVLLDVLVEFGLHVEPPRGIKPPPLIVALYKAADAHYSPIIDKALESEEYGALWDSYTEAKTWLASIASAQSQGTREQTDWMIAQAREGLRRAGGHDFDGGDPPPKPVEVTDEMVAALRYLADRENWLGDPLDQTSTLHGHFTPYELARAALGLEEGKRP